MAQRTQGFSGRGLYGSAGNTNTSLTLSVSIPLGRETRGAPILSGFVSHDDLSGTRVSSGVSGTLDERGNAAYSLSLSRDEQTPGLPAMAALITGFLRFPWAPVFRKDRTIVRVRSVHRAACYCTRGA